MADGKAVYAHFQEVADRRTVSFSVAPPRYTTSGAYSPMPDVIDASSNPQKDKLGTSVDGAPKSRDLQDGTEDAKQPVAASENDQKECTDQTPTQDADEEVAVAVATDEASDVDAEEKMKLERRRRRCPIVNAVERYLIDEDEGEKKESGNNRSSLARTIIREDVAGFLRLVQAGTRVWETDDHGWSPLHWASSRGSTVMTYAILQEMRSSQEAGTADCDEAGDAISDYLNATENLSGWTALHLATIAGKVDVVYLLMEAGCDPQVKDKVGDRPVNCIRRTRNLGGRAGRLRNALLDLSESEDSSCDETVGPTVGQKNKPAAVGVARPLRIKA